MRRFVFQLEINILGDEGKPTKLSVKVIQDSVMSQYLDGKYIHSTRLKGLEHQNL